MAPKGKVVFKPSICRFVSFSIKRSRDILKPPPRVMTNGIYRNISFKKHVLAFPKLFVLSEASPFFVSKEASDKVHFGTDVTVEA